MHSRHHKDNINTIIDLRLWCKTNWVWTLRHEVQIKDEIFFRTSFRTCYDHYDFVAMPFGLTNAPTLFMCLMNNILSNYLDKFVVIFIDDILIYSKNEQEHEEHLKIFLQVLREQQIYANFSKCEFFKDKIQYLRHVVSRMES